MKTAGRTKSLLSALASCAMVAGATLVANDAHAAYPEKPIVVVVPFAPGGSTDQIGRMIADHLNKDLNTPVVVENRPGASGTVGNAYVARAKADGYTLLIGGTDIVASQYLYKDLPYNPEQAFTPIGIVSEFPFLMLIDKKRGINTVEDYVNYAKKNTEKISFSSAGLGNSTHLAAETFRKAAGLNSLVHVPYNGSAQALLAVASSQVDFAFDPAISSIQLVHGDKAVALGVVAKKRLPILPDVPTMSEQGYKEFDQLSPWSWKGLFAPMGTPKEALDTLQKSLAKLLSDPEFQQRIESTASLVVAPQSTEEAQQFLTNQRKGWKALIASANIEAK